MGDQQATATTRRRVLSGLGAGVLSGLAGTRLIPDPVVAPDGGEPDRGSVDVPPDPLAEVETPYAVYQYRPTFLAGGFARTLPINVVFPLHEATFEDVLETFHDAGWTDSITEQPRFAYDRASGAYVPSTWTGGDDLYGIAGRLHVRCWRMNGRLSIQTHIDTSPQPGHRIRSFAVARHVVEASFREAGWSVTPRDLDFGNDQEPDHDGEASVITR